MSVITKGRIFANGEQLTAEKLNVLVDEAEFNSSTAVDNATTRVNASGAITVKPLGITSTELAASAVTKAKIENVANMKVLGNTSGSAAAPQEVDILDEDTMSSDSATAIATQQSIKAYVDSAPNFTPSTYAGEESVTLPNGFIIKQGNELSIPAGSSLTVTFGTAFPTSCVNVQATMNSSASSTNGIYASTLTASSFRIHNAHSAARNAFWMAIGY
jgi:hypothetical protein